MVARGVKEDDTKLNSMDIKVKIPARGLNTVDDKPGNVLNSNGKPKFLPKIEWSEHRQGPNLTLEE